MILIIISFIFFVWGKPFICSVMLLSFVFDFAFGLLCDKKFPKAVNIIALLADFAVNCGFYYMVNFTGFSRNFQVGNSMDLLFPLLSAVYFTRGFSYVYDVFFQNTKTEKNIFCLMTYILNFQLLTPITMVRYKDISPQIRERKVSVEEIKNGAFLFVIGLAKCVISAPAMQTVYKSSQSGYALDGIIKSFAFFAGIYFYLTGIADMSEGMGLISGFKYPRMYKDFRCGKGLCSVFLGFGRGINAFISEIVGRIFKNKYAVIFFSIAAVFIWYRPSVNFAAVGLAFGLLAVLEKFLYSKWLGRLRGIFKGIYCFAVIFFILNGIRFSDFTAYSEFIKSCFGGSALSGQMLDCIKTNLLVCLFALVYFTCYCSIKKSLLKFSERLESKGEKSFVLVRIVQLFAVSVLFIACIVIISQKGTLA